MDCLGTTPLKKHEQDVYAKQPPLLEDLRNHSPEQLAELRLLLSSGAPWRPDPQRRDIFEVEGHSHVFYISKFPSGAKVVLLAIWKRDQASEDTDAANIEQTGTGEQLYVGR